MRGVWTFCYIKIIRIEVGPLQNGVIYKFITYTAVLCTKISISNKISNYLNANVLTTYFGESQTSNPYSSII